MVSYITIKDLSFFLLKIQFLVQYTLALIVITLLLSIRVWMAALLINCNKKLYLGHFPFVELPARWREATGCTIRTPLSRSTPRTLVMVPPCNMVMWWAWNSRTVPTAPGWLTTAATFIPVAVAVIASHRAQEKTLGLASRSSRSCHKWSSEDLKLWSPQPEIQA